MNLSQVHKIAKADKYCTPECPVTLTGILNSDVVITTRNNKTFFATVANRKGSKVSVASKASIAVLRLVERAS